jgi:hypothetical protein
MLSKMEIEALGQAYLNTILQDGKTLDQCISEGARLLHGLNDEDAKAVLHAAAMDGQGCPCHTCHTST